MIARNTIITASGRLAPERFVTGLTTRPLKKRNAEYKRRIRGLHQQLGRAAHLGILSKFLNNGLEPPA